MNLALGTVFVGLGLKLQSYHTNSPKIEVSLRSRDGFRLLNSPYQSLEYKNIDLMGVAANFKRK